jgi:hypothetical protein
MVIHLHQCFECATLTEEPLDTYGNTYCNRHRTATILTFPSLCNSEEEYSPVEREVAVS